MPACRVVPDGALAAAPDAAVPTLRTALTADGGVTLWTMRVLGLRAAD
ncbi:conserved hypothetical protein [Bradyrhizobium sp. STM 3809]|nr:conserved hypothetical protein [Bradyrhizobium sp. STM 3809]